MLATRAICAGHLPSIFLFRSPVAEARVCVVGRRARDGRGAQAAEAEGGAVAGRAP